MLLVLSAINRNHNNKVLSAKKFIKTGLALIQSTKKCNGFINNYNYLNMNFMFNNEFIFKEPKTYKIASKIISTKSSINIAIIYLGKFMFVNDIFGMKTKLSLLFLIKSIFLTKLLKLIYSYSK